MGNSSYQGGDRETCVVGKRERPRPPRKKKFGDPGTGKGGRKKKPSLAMPWREPHTKKENRKL